MTQETRIHKLSTKATIGVMLEALRMARKKLEMWPEGMNPEFFSEMKAIDDAIYRAEQVIK